MEARFMLRLPRRVKQSRLAGSLRHQHTSGSSRTSSSRQANPIGDYYASLLEVPLPKIKSKPPTTATPQNKPTSFTSTKVSADSATDSPKPAILFSSRLNSPAERKSEIQRKSTLVAGVWVPPRPDEPDNCCMSGCVNCVWDLYRDEMEEWALRRKEADHALKKEKSLEGARKKRRRADTGLSGSTGKVKSGHAEDDDPTAASMDDDGGGSATLWGKPLDSDPMGEDLYKNIPVGIREFMKQEKRLKEKHVREAASDTG